MALGTSSPPFSVPRALAFPALRSAMISRVGAAARSHPQGQDVGLAGRQRSQRGHRWTYIPGSLPSQDPYTQDRTAAQLGGRGAVAPVTPGSDFLPGSETRGRHAGTLRKSPASSGRWRSSGGERPTLRWPARACAKVAAAEDAGRHQEALRASWTVSACSRAVALAERHPDAGGGGARLWFAES